MHSQLADFLQEIHFTHSSPGAEFLKESPHHTIYVHFFLGDSIWSFLQAFPFRTGFLDDLLCLGTILLWCCCQNSAFHLSTIINFLNFLGPAFENGRTCSVVLVSFTPEREYTTARLHPHSQLIVVRLPVAGDHHVRLTVVFQLPLEVSH